MLIRVPKRKNRFRLPPALLGAPAVFRADEAGALRLSASAAVPPRLGWNSWLPVDRGSFLRRSDATDAVFDAEMIERQASSKAA